MRVLVRSQAPQSPYTLKHSPQGGDIILPLPLNSQVPGALVSEQAPRTGARGDRGGERGGWGVVVGTVKALVVSTLTGRF